MVDVFVANSEHPVEVVEVASMGLTGGCLGCLSCGYDRRCVYRDDFPERYRSTVLSADAVVIAVATKDRLCSWRLKMLLDRSFFGGRCPVRSEPHVAHLVSGPLRQLPVLREILVAHAEWRGQNVLGFVTDEYESSDAITTLLKALARRVTWALDSGARKPATFLGEAARRTIRDRIFVSRAVFRKDHSVLRDEGFYDFPRISWSARIRDWLLGIKLRNPRRRAAFYRELRRRTVERFMA
jgi:hypothetical protein